ncbi:hypothetical protein RvY_15843 [Ramazzottius varieornatus]|uniref:Uncharacterized protein n=1 Tax=Ramazzottius varieornatus TaxID=947166 RepID=A0A1D1VZF3_RAMVA|nr:hypothetical protein RvY_15843 [Ramazzottius varieornatus]
MIGIWTWGYRDPDCIVLRSGNHCSTAALLFPSYRQFRAVWEATMKCLTSWPVRILSAGSTRRLLGCSEYFKTPVAFVTGKPKNRFLWPQKYARVPKQTERLEKLRKEAAELGIPGPEKLPEIRPTVYSMPTMLYKKYYTIKIE